MFDPAIFGDKQHHSKYKDSREGKSGAEIMQDVIYQCFKDHNRLEERFPVTRGDNRRIEGWRNVRQWLRIDEGRSKFRVFENCTSFITTFPANVYDKHQPEDLDTDGEDHTADELRYALMSRPPETDLHIEQQVNPNSAWAKVLALRKEKKRRYHG